jgi:Alginate lyase
MRVAARAFGQVCVAAALAASCSGGRSAVSHDAGAGGAGGAEAGGGDHDAGLDPNVAPGGNFDLSLWELQEPVGAAGAPTTISPAALEGPGGFRDSYFFTDPTDGAMTFWDPENGVTTADSSYPRSELREMNADGSTANWPISGTNLLSATVAVTEVPDHVCVGQIHLGTAIQAGLAASTKPLLELYYYATGAIQLGIENDPTGGQTSHPITNVPLGTPFSYTVQLTGDGTITLGIDGATTTFAMPASFNGYGQYFKAGDYDQTAGTDATIGATVKFYALQVSHR